MESGGKLSQLQKELIQSLLESGLSRQELVEAVNGIEKEFKIENSNVSQEVKDENIVNVQGTFTELTTASEKRVNQQKTLVENVEISQNNRNSPANNIVNETNDGVTYVYAVLEETNSPSVTSKANSAASEFESKLASCGVYPQEAPEEIPASQGLVDILLR